MDELKRQMARGDKHGASPGSSGNIMPGPSAAMGSSMGRAPSGGGSSTIMGIPSRTGAYNPVAGSYKPTLGQPTSHAITPGNVSPKQLGGASNATGAMLAHGRVLAGVKAIRDVHGDHPHLQMAHAKSTAHIAGYKSKFKKMPTGPKFGSLGGSSVPGAGPNTPGSQPTGMGKIDPNW